MDDAEIRAKLEQGSGYRDLPGRHVTINQVAAWNLAYFRKAAGLTQEELGARLGWSKAIVSAAERSWDGRRVRHFSADDLISIAMALNVPVTALFLPPEDDGVDARYLFHAVNLVTGGGTAALAEWSTMHDLMTYVMSEPADDDSPVMDAYRRRYVGAISTYFDDPRGAELVQYLEDLTTEERIVERLARLRGQYDALRGMLIDIDRLQEAMTERLFEVRKGRPGAPRDRSNSHPADPGTGP